MAAEPSFEWDEDKSRVNQEKHGVAFETAQLAFLDERRVIAEDLSPQRGRAALLLLRHSAWRRHDSALPMARGPNPHFWRRLLAQRQETL
jgi:ribonuclease toxin BrnT of type II toxin-antitoxin system